jgi:transposase
MMSASDPELEFIDDDELAPEDNEEDALIANIANKLNDSERKVFLAAMEKVRDQARKGKVRIREPNAEERLILDAFERYGYKAKDTAEALGVDVNRVYIVTRRYNARPVESNIPALKNPSEHMLRFMRSMWAEGKSMREMSEVVREIAHLDVTPNYHMMKSLCDKAGIDTTRPKFDVRNYPELIDDFDSIGEKWGFAVGTLHQHYMRAKKAAKGLPT